MFILSCVMCYISCVYLSASRPMNLRHLLSDVRCLMSNVRCQMSDVRHHMTDIRFQIFIRPGVAGLIYKQL